MTHKHLPILKDFANEKHDGKKEKKRMPDRNSPLEALFETLYRTDYYMSFLFIPLLFPTLSITFKKWKMNKTVVISPGWPVFIDLYILKANLA